MVSADTTFRLVRVQKGPYLFFFIAFKDIKCSDLLPLLLPQPHFWEKKNPNFLICRELGFLNVVPPGLEPGTN